MNVFKKMEKPTRWRNDETLLLKCSLCASKARDNILLSMNDNFFNFPRDLSFCADDDYEDHETWELNIDKAHEHDTSDIFNNL